MINSKTFFLAAFAALFAGSAMTATVQAKPFPIIPKPIPMPLPKPIVKPGPCYGCGGGYGGAGIVAGLAAAAVITAAASASAASDACWYEHRWVDTDYGPRRVSVRVCD